LGPQTNHHLICIFFEDFRVAYACFSLRDGSITFAGLFELSVGMNELASGSVGTVHSGVELFAELSLILAGHVLLL